MTLRSGDAERILRGRLGDPAKDETQYVIGFHARGKVLAMDRRAAATRLWFEPPEPPELDGVRLIARANGNSNINGPLVRLRAPTTLRVEITHADALHRFLDWYVGSRAEQAPAGAGEAPAVDERLASVAAMCQSVENTVRNSNGQAALRTIKNKDLRMTSAELEALIVSLLDRQDNRCALTGIPFHFLGPDADKNLLPSLDRIDSNGHYEPGNLQIVCQFINFWKSDTDDGEFRRLLALVRATTPDAATSEHAEPA